LKPPPQGGSEGPQPSSSVQHHYRKNPYMNLPFAFRTQQCHVA
jgi:hypothetical protein